jgi:PAS domain S-box-containing protein
MVKSFASRAGHTLPSGTLSREEDLRRLADVLPQLVWIAQPDGRIDYYNQCCLDYTGMTREELEGWGWQHVLHPDEVDVKLTRWAESLRTGTQFEIEYRLRRADGRYIWHLGRALPFRDESGQIGRWFGTSTNIEAQKRAEEALAELRRAEEEVSLLHTIIMEVAVAPDLTASLQVVLRRVCERTGWTIGQAWVVCGDGSCLECSPAWSSTVEGQQHFREVSQAICFPPGIGLPGRVWTSRQPEWVRDVTLDTNFPRVQAAREVGLKAALAIPIVAKDTVVAVLEFFLQEPRHEDERLVKVIETVAAELDLVLERKQAEDALRHQQVTLRESYERIQDLAGRLLVAEEAERSRIARDLHDDINQQVAALSIALSRLKRRISDADRAILNTELMSLQERAIALADSVRRLSHELHPGALQHAGLTVALESHCAEFREQYGIDVTFDGELDLNALEPDVALCLFRVAQELLRNVAKHAGAHRIRVGLCRDTSVLTMTIADDGRGFDAGLLRRGGGLGLLSIEERARLVHGHVSIESGAARGTTVKLTVPMDP